MSPIQFPVMGEGRINMVLNSTFGGSMSLILFSSRYSFRWFLGTSLFSLKMTEKYFMGPNLCYTVYIYNHVTSYINDDVNLSYT